MRTGDEVVARVAPLALPEVEYSLGPLHTSQCLRTGLCILHYGSIVVSRHARIGARCTLNSCVNIGVSPSGGGSALIGDDVYIGPGVKVWNEIRIADGCILGANACVSKDVVMPGSVVVGANRVLAK